MRLADDDEVGISSDVIRRDREVVGETAQELVLFGAQQQMLAARFIEAFAVEFDLRGENASLLALPARLVEQTVVPGDPSRSRLTTHACSFSVAWWVGTRSAAPWHECARQCQ